MRHGTLFVFAFLFVAAQLLSGQQTLDGAVVDAQTGGPLASVRVKLEGAPAALYAVTDPQGRFHFAPTQRRVYTLSVERPGYSSSSSGVDLRATGERPAMPELRIALRRQAIITGFVTDPNGAPPTYSGLVEIYTRRGPSGSVPALVDRVIADDRGQYRTPPLDPGTYYLAVTYDIAPQFWDRSWHTGYYPHAATIEAALPIELQSGQEFRADLQILRVSGAQLSGLFQVPAVNSPEISETSSLITARRQSTSREDALPVAVTGGEYTLPNLAPDLYTVTAETQGYDTLTQSWKHLFGATQQIEIGGQDARLDLALLPLPVLQGSVSFVDGCPAVPVRIVATGVETTTAPDGTFVLPSFGPGKIRLGAAPASGDPRVTLASVHLGERDVFNQLLDYPFSGSADVQIAMKCVNRGSK